MVARRGGGRIDENQPAIVAALRKIGASVLIASSVGCGVPDLIVGFMGRTFLMEVKNRSNTYGRKGLNARQKEWAREWRGAPVLVVTDEHEAVNAVLAYAQGGK